MNENIDLRKILKDCPKDWKFYSTIFGEETYISSIDNYEGNPCPITIYYGKLGEAVIHRISINGHPFADGCGECCLFPSNEMRDWSKFTAPWYKKEEKNKRFDPHTFQPFDKVLVRDDKDQKWECGLFSHIDKNYEDFPFLCTGSCYKICIPYNDETKCLAGTTDEAPEYYRYWDK